MALEAGVAAGWDDAYLLNAAIDTHRDDPEFGYRFIADELAGRGIVAGRNTVNRLCAVQRLCSVHSRERGLNRKPGPPVHDDLGERQFTAPVLNRAVVRIEMNYVVRKYRRQLKETTYDEDRRLSLDR